MLNFDSEIYYKELQLGNTDPEIGIQLVSDRVGDDIPVYHGELGDPQGRLGAEIILRAYGFEGFNLNGYRTITTSRNEIFSDVFYGVIPVRGLDRLIYARNYTQPQVTAEGVGISEILISVADIPPYLNTLQELAEEARQNPKGKVYEDSNGQIQIETFLQDEIDEVLRALVFAKLGRLSSQAAGV